MNLQKERHRTRNRKIPPPNKGEGTSAKRIDMGKVMALKDAGWSVPKIADEIGVSAQTIYYRLKKEEEK